MKSPKYVQHVVAFLLLSVVLNFAYAQPALESILTLDAAISGAKSVASDAYGQHLVGVYNGYVKHFLIGNDGAIVYQNFPASVEGDYPVVTSLYVVRVFWTDWVVS